MKVKRYVVDSLPDAMDQIKVDLGKDAIILHTKKIKIGGFLGLFGKERVEVIAAIDPEAKKERQEKSQMKFEPPIQEQRQIQKQNEQQQSEQAVLHEMNELKRLMVNLMIKPEGNQQVYQQKEIMDIYNKLVKQGVEEEIATHIIEDVLVENEGSTKNIDLWAESKKHIIRKLQGKNAKEIRKDCKIVHFVGPTGVGKTTTIAKLAAEQVLKHNKRIAFITADTYRIAAVEQLKTYAEILNAPIEVVFSAQEIEQAVDKLKHDYDLLFMDTAGRNYHDDMYISELSNMLAKNNDSETYLVLSLTHKYEDMVSILEKFKKIAIDKILFTKSDETLSFGAIMNIVSKFPYGVSYITNGQNVPDDIEIFDEEKIASIILGV